MEFISRVFLPLDYHHHGSLPFERVPRVDKMWNNTVRDLVTPNQSQILLILQFFRRCPLAYDMSDVSLFLNV